MKLQGKADGTKSAGRADSLASASSESKRKPTPKKMKKLALTLASVCASAAFAFAQTTTTTTTTTTSNGTLTTYTPGSAFVVKETEGPVTYSYGENVTYVTKSGKTLTDADVATRVKAGIPVSVGYTTVGEKRVVNRVEIED